MKLSPTPVTALGRDVVAHWGRERRTLRQGFIALGLATIVGMGAGVVLGSMQGLLARFPGLLVLIPAAIGMRGAIFGALGARLGTGIITGQFERGLQRGGFVWSNLQAAALLTLASSALAAVAARIVASMFGLPTISLWHLVTVSMGGGVLSSLFIMAGVLVLANTAQGREWDMDAIGSPLITAAGDLVTLPAIVVATLLIRSGFVATVLGVVFLLVAVGAVWLGVRTPSAVTRRVVRESLVVLTYAGLVDIMAGTVLQTRVEDLISSPALLVLIPPFVASLGSIGGILSARLGSGLHLGLLTPRRIPERLATLEGSLTVLFGVAAFTGVGLIAHSAAVIAGFSSPGLLQLVAVGLVGGLLALGLLFTTAYVAATSTYRFGLDPDNHGIPIVTATMDFLGVLCLVAAIALIGVG